ncbi:MAG: hypothetical protein GY720_14530 [bacterium]|nr:hypothetical protein [bacterium]
MSESESFSVSPEAASHRRHTDVRLAVVVAPAIGLAFNPFGSEAIDAIRGRNVSACSELEASMYAAIDAYKHDDAEMWDSVRTNTENLYNELSCSSSRYRMYTLENRL